MNMEQAQQLGQNAFELLILAAEYEGLYRRGRPTHDSPEAAWDLAALIDMKQAAICSQLDAEALSDKYAARLPPWRGFGDVMDVSLAKDMIGAVANLVTYCTQSNEQMINIMQHIISRMLDPKIIHDQLIQP